MKLDMMLQLPAPALVAGASSTKRRVLSLLERPWFERIWVSLTQTLTNHFIIILEGVSSVLTSQPRSSRRLLPLGIS